MIDMREERARDIISDMNMIDMGGRSTRHIPWHDRDWHGARARDIFSDMKMIDMGGASRDIFSDMRGGGERDIILSDMIMIVMGG